MTTRKRNAPNLGLVIGVLGVIAGIGLLFTDNLFIGIFGTIASAGVAYKGYQDSNEMKS